MLLPSQKSSSYSILKFVYVISQLRHSLVVHPLLKKTLAVVDTGSQPGFIETITLWHSPYIAGL